MDAEEKLPVLRFVYFATTYDLPIVTSTEPYPPDTDTVWPELQQSDYPKCFCFCRWASHFSTAGATPMYLLLPTGDSSDRSNWPPSFPDSTPTNYKKLDLPVRKETKYLNLPTLYRRLHPRNPPQLPQNYRSQIHC